MKYEYDIRVDRKSVLGNPYYMKDESLRDEVCKKYEIYFKDKIKNDEVFRKEVWRLINVYRKYGKMRLFCWCAPKRCHSETIKKFIEDFINT